MYQMMATTPELEFEFFLAEQLHMLVEDLRKRMSTSEFIGWWVYYGRLAQKKELELNKIPRR